MSRTLPRPRILSFGKSVCEITLRVGDAATRFLSSVWEGVILAHREALSTAKRIMQLIEAFRTSREESKSGKSWVGINFSNRTSDKFRFRLEQVVWPSN